MKFEYWYVMISGSVIHGHYICPTDWVHQRSRGSPTTFWSTTVPSSDTNSSTPRLGRGWPGARLGPAWLGSKHVKTLVQPGEPQKCGVNIYIHGYINDYTWWVYKWRKININKPSFKILRGFYFILIRMPKDLKGILRCWNRFVAHREDQMTLYLGYRNDERLSAGGGTDSGYHTESFKSHAQISGNR